MKKRLLALLLAATMVVSLAACDNNTQKQPEQQQQEQEQPKATEAPKATNTPIPVQEMKFTQSSTVKSTVKVEDRLPVKDDIFVELYDCNGDALEIGTYSAAFNWANGGGGWDIARPSLESIIHYNSDGSYYPNVIKSFEVSADNKVWTFHLRQGMKWSDGEDFDADDIVFWYEKCHKTNWDTKASWSALLDDVTGNFCVLTKVDKYTVTWTFENAKPAGNFIENGDFKFCWAPEHYLSDLISVDFGGTLTEEQVLANAKKKGITYSSAKDIGKKCVYYSWYTPGLPSLNPWVLTTQEGLNNYQETCQLVRNEYFWKVDAQGQQLPYFDVLNMVKFDANQQELAFLSGELDCIEVGMQDIQTMIEKAAAQGNTVVLSVAAGAAWGSEQFTFNYTCDDKKLAELFNKKEFRQAFSICVDRDEMSALITDGFLTPSQCGPSEGEPGYSADWLKKWTEYDVASAKKLLESCGLVMGSDGYYQFADGTKLELNFFGYNTEDSAATTFSQFNQYFKAAGLKCTYTAYDVAYFDELIDTNKWTAVYGPHTAVGSQMADRPAPIVPISGAGGAEWYGQYGYYYETNGAQGVKPTGDMAKLVELYDQWKLAATPEQRASLEKQILKLHEENLWTIAYLTSEGTYTLVNSKLHNYPTKAVSIDKYQYNNIKHPWVMFEK